MATVYTVKPPKQLEEYDSSTKATQKNMQQNYTNPNLCSYLAGLIEGDGTIAVHEPNGKLKKYNPKIIIVFKRSDLKFANYLCELTGCGLILDKPERGYILWQIQDLLSVFKITRLINGYMRTPKQEALGRVIDWMNDYIKINNNSNLPSTKSILSSIFFLNLKPLDNSPIDSNAWLAGFLDSDGNFSISLSKRTKTHLDKVSSYMRLEIRQTYHKSSLTFNSSYYFVMSKIASYLDVNLNNRERLVKDKIYSSFIVTASSQKSLDLLINYLNKFPLLSSKYLDYLSWIEIIEFIKVHGNNNVPGGVWNLACIKRKDFNKTRTTFTWKHLNKTYIS